MDMPNRHNQRSVHQALGGRMRDAMFGLSDDFPKVVELDLARIRPNPDQPRKSVDEGTLRELASSIEQHGLLQPIVVKAAGEGHMLVAGQRRFLAHQRLGRQTIFAIVTEGNPDELALIENLQRENLKPLEEAEALAGLKERHGYSQDELARIVAKAKSTISEILSLNELPEAIKGEVRTSELPVSKSMLIEITRLKSEPEQLKLWEQVKGGRATTVRTARQQKETDASPDSQTPTTKMLATGRSFVRRLQRVELDDIVDNRDQCQALIELHREISAYMETLQQILERRK
jgi:ParB family transcriptional regulator, chromosome partitioning protein